MPMERLVHPELDAGEDPCLMRRAAEAQMRRDNRLKMRALRIQESSESCEFVCGHQDWSDSQPLAAQSGLLPWSQKQQ